MRVTFGQPSNPQSSALAVFAYKDGALTRGAQGRDEGDRLARAMQAGRFDGDVANIAEILAPAGVDASRLLIVGLGAGGKADRGAFERIGGALAARLLMSGETTLVIDMDGVDDIAIGRAEAAARLAYGAVLRSYRFDTYRTKLSDKQKPTLTELIVVNAGEGAQSAFDRLRATIDGVFFTRDLISEPANVLYPESFVERCRQVLDGTGVEIEVLDEDRMRELGMGALLGVAQGSVRKPQLLVMKWDGSNGNAKKPVVLVGKGVTFDTGGISIKPAAGMEDMKWDMGGASAVAGAMLALARRKAKAHVIGICGLVENMPDGNAQRPGDVVTSMSGQTIEVINTDAEGRLVLADAIWYAQETYQPEAIVDLATLTGAMIIALGHEYAGLFSNDDTLARQLTDAGTASGDRLWRFPLGEAYDKLLESQIADMKNVGPRDGGSITAAQFIQRFVKEGVKWAHLDIAGTVWTAKPGALWDKGATGYGVRLLDKFVEDNFENEVTEVGFYHLTRQPLEAVLPRLLEKAHAARHRILVHCADADQLKRLDELLWTYDDRSFLPHGSDYKELQPILLTTSEGERANNPDLLVALKSLDVTNFVQFARVLYLFEETDAAALAAARSAWTALKDREGIARTYWQQDERGRWVKKQ